MSHHGEERRELRAAHHRELGRAGRGVAAASLYEAAFRLRGLILLPILTRHMDASTYGLYVQSAIIIALGAIVTGLFMHHTLVRFLPGERDAAERGSTLYAALSVNLAGCLTILPVLMVCLAHFNKSLSPLIPPLTLLIAAEVFIGCFTNYFRGTERILLYSAVGGAVVITDTVVIAVSAVAGVALPLILWRMFAANAFILILTALFVLREVPRIRPRWDRIRKMLRFSLSLLAWGMAVFAVESSDRLLIGRLLGEQWTGYYNPAYVLGALIAILPRLTGVVLSPMAARLHDDGEHAVLRRLVNSYWKTLLVVGVPYVVGCLLFQNAALSLLATPEIASRAAGVCPIVALATLCSAGAAVYGEVLKVCMRPGYVARAWLFAAVLSLGCNLVLLRQIGVIGSALAFLLAAGAAFGIIYREAAKAMPLSLQASTALRCVVATIPMAAACIIFQPVGIGMNLLVAALGMIAYVFLLIPLRVLRIPDLRSALSATFAGRRREEA